MPIPLRIYIITNAAAVGDAKYSLDVRNYSIAN